MENPGIEPGTPGLQEIGLSPTPRAKVLFVAMFLGYNWFMVLWFYVQEHLKAQPVVVLILKRLRRQGHSLKARPTNWERRGIEPAIPGLQDIGLSPTPRRLAQRYKQYHLT